MTPTNPAIPLAKLKACLFTAARATSLQEVQKQVRRANDLANEIQESLLDLQLMASVAEQRRCREVGGEVVAFRVRVREEAPHLTVAYREEEKK